MDWVDWHNKKYDDPTTGTYHRLLVVRQRIRETLDAAPPGPIRVLSMCAGQGRDLLPVLEDHPRAPDVHAILAELDPTNAAIARQSAPPGTTVITGDAALTSTYAPVVPVNLALVCGVFGNIPDDQIRTTITHLPRLCGPDATVIWTRHREPPDFTPTIRSWFADNGFEEIVFDTEPGYHYSVGTHRLTGPTLPYHNNLHLFTFSDQNTT